MVKISIEEPIDERQSLFYIKILLTDTASLTTNIVYCLHQKPLLIIDVIDRDNLFG